MTTDHSQRLECQLRDLMVKGSLDRLVRRLEYGFRADYATVEDAIAEAVLKLLHRVEQGDVDDVAAWVRVVAANILKAKVQAKEKTATRDDMWDEVPDEKIQAEAQVVGQMLLDYLKSKLSHWENRKMATITQLYLEGAFNGEPLSLREARDLTEEILGEPVEFGSVGTWKDRGFARLEREADQDGLRD